MSDRGHQWARYSSKRHQHISGFQVCNWCGLVFSNKRQNDRRYNVCRNAEEEQ